MELIRMLAPSQFNYEIARKEMTRLIYPSIYTSIVYFISIFTIQFIMKSYRPFKVIFFHF